MKNTVLGATACFFLILAACKKDDNNPVPTEPVAPPTTAELITSTTWKIDTIGFDADKNGSIDTGVPGGFRDCDLDNTLTFAEDSTGIFDEGALRCDDSVPQSVPFSWQLAQSDSIVNIEGNLPGELHGDINLLTVSDSTLVLSKQVPFGSAATANLIISLKK